MKTGTDTSVEKKELLPFRSPGVIAFLALISFFALYLSEEGSPVLPVLGALLGFSYVLTSRISNTPPQSYVVRALLFSIVIVFNSMRPNAEVINMFDIRSMRWVGELAAAELTLHFWLRPLGRDKLGPSIVLSGVIFMSACSTLDDRYLPLLTPAYILFLLLSMRLLRPKCLSLPFARTIKTYAFLIFSALALTLGAVHFFLLHTYRNEIMAAVMKQVGDRLQTEGGDLNLRAGLGSRFGQNGSTGRALVIEGNGNFSHLRAATYETYSGGTWQPNPVRRPFTPLLPNQMQSSSNSKGSNLQITRMSDNNGFLFLPLNCQSVGLPQNAYLEWSAESGGPVRSEPSNSAIYQCSIAEDDTTQGFLCAPPEGKMREDLLATPDNLDEEVKALALKIVEGKKTPLDKVEAIETYLQTNYRYSLSIDIGHEEPLSKFLLKKMAAHCEYFGSAMTILSRCVGVPSRYVVGYYAHETLSPGVTVARQRDAHAWSECYIEGKGWITADATPSSGLPDRLYGELSPWVKITEKWQDLIQSVKIWFQKSNKVALVAGIGIVVGLFFLAQLLLLRRKPAPTLEKTFEYSSADVEIKKLYQEFTALCEKGKLDCPPMKTWSDYLSSLDAETFDKSGLESASLLTFLKKYNSLRFGANVTAQMILSLKNDLVAIENAKSQRSRDESRKR